MQEVTVLKSLRGKEEGGGHSRRMVLRNPDKVHEIANILLLLSQERSHQQETLRRGEVRPKLHTEKSQNGMHRSRHCVGHEK